MIELLNIQFTQFHTFLVSSEYSYVCWRKLDLIFVIVTVPYEIADIEYSPCLPNEYHFIHNFFVTEDHDLSVMILILLTIFVHLFLHSKVKNLPVTNVIYVYVHTYFYHLHHFQSPTNHLGCQKNIALQYEWWVYFWLRCFYLHFI